jgi:tRNA threonylcarbamoyladenosine biosynthesis protein TsaE
MTSKQIRWLSDSPETTRKLGHRIGRALAPPVVLALIGDLGSGKTAFVQGLAGGLGVSPDYYVTSPTYTLINEYPGRHSLFHIDLYRIGGPDDFEAIGLYDILHDSNAVVAIEWAERLKEALPADHLAVHFEIVDDTRRNILLTTHGLGVSNLLKGWK